MYKAAIFSFSLPIAFNFFACKTSAPSSKTQMKSEKLSEDSASHAAVRIHEFDLKTLKTHLSSVVRLLPAEGKRDLWSIFLTEAKPNTPCHGLVSERYYFYGLNSDGDVSEYYLAVGTPMPMNGPCGFAWDITEKSYSDVNATLTDSAPLSDIGTFNRIKISPADAVKSAERQYPNFRYQDGIKIFHHPHPNLMRDPWYMIYGTACGRDSTVMINAFTGHFMDTIETPTNPCPDS
jgi:hypothetical protein